MDLEGHELPTLRGWKEFLEQKRAKAIYLEIIPENQSRYDFDSQAPLDFLESMGYTLFLCKAEDFGAFGREPSKRRFANGPLVVSSFRAHEYPPILRPAFLRSRKMDNRPKEKIFILRNNDLGGVLVATPLIQGLRQAFPGASLSMGVGKWAFSLLENNPEIDQVIPCNAPWHNKSNCRHPANSRKPSWRGCFTFNVFEGSETLEIEGFSRGIGVLGSRQGSWLMRRAKIPRRFGVKGYAGGDGWCESCVVFREDRSVALAALDFPHDHGEERRDRASAKNFPDRRRNLRGGKKMGYKETRFP